MALTASARGRANRNKGARAEVAVVNWLRDHGHPRARRYLAGDGRQPGDVDGVPGLVIEVKSVKSSAWGTWCSQAEKEANGTPWVVVRRLDGCTDVGQWPCIASATAIGTHPARTALSIVQCLNRIQRPEWPAGRWLGTYDGDIAGQFAWLFDGGET